MISYIGVNCEISVAQETVRGGVADSALWIKRALSNHQYALVIICSLIQKLFATTVRRSEERGTGYDCEIVHSNWVDRSSPGPRPEPFFSFCSIYVELGISGLDTDEF